ncbi:MAG: PTS sugar transporter subunit IIA [Alphaproteobacteria bacterium]|nr:PTS sugar transporter subunit IIA [Alphaproteobacteria bacterium]
MLGIVIVTHGKLAEAFVDVTQHVVGKQEQMLAVGIEPEDDAEAARERIIKAIAEVDSGEGVVVLTDMFGGTPSNLAISVMKNDGVEVIAGVNLPMMIKLASVRGKVPLADAVNQAQDAARKYINVAGNLLASK